MTEHAARSSSRRRAWRWYAAHFVAHRGALGLLVAASAVVALIQVPAAFAIHHALDVSIPAHQVFAAAVMAALVVGCRLIAAALTLVVVWRSTTVARRVTAAIRAELLEDVYALDWLDQVGLDVDRAHSRIVFETERLEHLAHSLLLTVLPNALPLAAYGVVLLIISWPLALILLALTILLQLGHVLAAQRLKRAITQFQARFERFAIATRRALHMLPTARAQGTERAELAVQRTAAEELSIAGARMAMRGAVTSQVGAIGTAIVMVGFVVGGGAMVAAGDLTLGALAAFAFVAVIGRTAIAGIVGALESVLSGDGALMRVDELRTAAARALIPPGADAPDAKQGMRFAGVVRAFGDHTVLRGLDLVVEPSCVTAIQGGNGEGKSTLISIALGLLDPDSGEVILGGGSLLRVDRAAWRACVGFVPQHPRFFAGTIEDNIVCGRTGVTPASLSAACELAGLDPVIAARPGGVAAQVGDDGSALSGGERQRIALARALVHRPSVILLDEPTNHLDAASVAGFVDRLRALPQRPTVLIATHDPALLEQADHVYEIDGGRARQA